jgi:hypothetical protein
MNNVCLAESLKVLNELDYRPVHASYGESTLQEGWHPPLEPGQYYGQSWMPDWAANSEQNVIHIEVDPARPRPADLILK